MAKRHLKIEMTCEPDKYDAIANLIWHVMNTQGVEYDVFHDRVANAGDLNKHWDALVQTNRWRG